MSQILRIHVLAGVFQLGRDGSAFPQSFRKRLPRQILPGDSPRSEGGFGIYDAPEPWGPWTTAYFTQRWDVGPGETSSIPPKWMSPCPADAFDPPPPLSTSPRHASGRGFVRQMVL